MVKLLSAKDISQAMGCNMDTARKYMRRMIHTEKPLRVTEETFEAWVNGNSYKPSGAIVEAAKPRANMPISIPRKGRKTAG